VQPLHALADGVDHPPHLAVASLVDRELEPRGREPPDLRRPRRPVVELDTVAETVQLLVRRPLPRLDLVDLVDLVARVREPVRELAVVRQEQRTRRLGVEPADRDHARRMVDEPDDRRPPLRVAGGGDDARRLVEQDVRELLLREPLAVQSHVVGGADERVELRRAAVDRDTARFDQLVRLASRRDARAREPGVQAH
jgi:hypothetical protein